MPAPTKAQLQSLIDGFLQQEGLKGENAPDFADAMAATVADSLTMFMSQMMVAPGIACTPAATAAPGMLM